MKRLVLFLLAFTIFSWGDAGILIPRDKSQPDASVLSLEEMEIDIRIDNGDARVFIRQIFANHTSNIEEGNYIFALPSQATVSDFAVWDGTTRIPAVVLERKRAEEIYTQLKQQAIDPGLLQMGERGSEEAKRSAAFSARIVPILPYGTKRLEFEYHQSIPVENLKSYFAIPLRPDAYQSQTARYITVNLDLESANDFTNFQSPAKTFPLQIEQNTTHHVKAHFHGENVNLGEDFVITYDLNPAASDKLEVLTYRNPTAPQPSPTELTPTRPASQPGFFEAEALIGNGRGNVADSPASTAKNILVLFDTSLSMQWDKLERSYQALETLLTSLRPSDRFNLLLFNTRTQLFQTAALPASQANIQRALEFVRSSKLRGGTDLQKALEAALDACSAANAGNNYLVLISDGGATRGPILTSTLAKRYAESWKQLPQPQRPRTYVFAVDDDTNLPLLTILAQQDGVIEHVLSTEPIDFKLRSFLSKIGRSPVGQLQLSLTPASGADAVYPLQAEVFSGSVAQWVGKYESPQDNITFTMRGTRDGSPLEISAKANFPRESLDHPQLPRLWARARVDALLEKIAREGEDQASIDEIIRLAREYKFVTPYTSFLAAPRALLRPRVIRPGDPVLRVRTDESIVSVTALFPFGLIQKLRHLAGEDSWQTRFLAPDDMQDGTYTVRLILRDGAGHTYRESKTFVIASKPPVIQVKLRDRRLHRGQALDLRVNASQNTRTLIARLPGSAPAWLRWNAQAGANTGQLFIPQDSVPGTYRVTVTAEDIAHNIATQEVQLEVLP